LFFPLAGPLCSCNYGDTRELVLSCHGNCFVDGKYTYNIVGFVGNGARYLQRMTACCHQNRADVEA
jgi:hypothetical protein